MNSIESTNQVSSDLNLINVEKYYKNHIAPGQGHLWLLAIPGLGWIVYVLIWAAQEIDRSKANRVLINYEQATKTEEKIKWITLAVQKAHVIQWRYRLFLMREYLIQGRNEEALKELKNIGSKAEEVPEYWHLKGELLCRLEKFAEASLAYQKAITCKPEINDDVLKNAAFKALMNLPYVHQKDYVWSEDYEFLKFIENKVENLTKTTEFPFMEKISLWMQGLYKDFSINNEFNFIGRLNRIKSHLDKKNITNLRIKYYSTSQLGLEEGTRFFQLGEAYHSIGLEKEALFYYSKAAKDFHNEQAQSKKAEIFERLLSDLSAAANMPNAFEIYCEIEKLNCEELTSLATNKLEVFLKQYLKTGPSYLDLSVFYFKIPASLKEIVKGAMDELLANKGLTREILSTFQKKGIPESLVFKVADQYSRCICSNGKSYYSELSNHFVNILCTKDERGAFGAIDLKSNCELLGQGSYGKVWKIFDFIGKQFLALKISIRHYTSNLLNEFNVLQRIHNNGIIDGIQKPHKMVINFLNGNVGAILSLYEGSVQNLKEISAQDFIKNFDRLVKALKFMGDNDIFNADIKPANILYENGNWDLSDHGGTEFMNDPNYLENKSSQNVDSLGSKQDRALAHNARQKALNDPKFFNYYKEVQKRRMVKNLKATFEMIRSKVSVETLTEENSAKITQRLKLFENSAPDSSLPDCCSINELYSGLQKILSDESKIS